MEYLFAHFGQELPNHLPLALKQFRVSNPQMAATILVNGEIFEMAKPLADQFSLKLVECSDHEAYSFVHIQKEKPYDPWSFWNTACRRIYHIRDYMSEHGANDIFHADNDVLIYSDIEKEILPAVGSLIDNEDMLGLLITRTKWQDLVFSFSYIPCPYPLNYICEFIKWALNEPGFQAAYGCDMVHEMSLLSACQKTKPEVLIELPTLPSHKDADLFGGLFDPAGYGHWLGGWWLNGNNAGWTDSSHYVGKAIQEGVISCGQEQGQIPKIKDLASGKSFRLHSLHVHSKQLEKFMAGISR